MRAARIYCDAATRNGAMLAIEFEEHGPIAVKGKAQKVPVFRPTGVLRAVRKQRRGKTFGRDRELAIADALLDRAARCERGGLVFVEGEAGMGKSIVLAAAAERAQARGIRVIRSLAHDAEKSTPYFVWRPVFLTLLGLTDRTESASLDRILEMLVEQPQLMERAPLLNAVLGSSLPDNELTSQLVGEVRAENTLRFLVGLLTSVLESTPTLILLEDAHWFDSASWALLRLACEGRVSMMVASRPLGDHPPDEAAQIAALTSTVWLKLGSLSTEDVRAMLAEQLGVDSVPDRLVAYVQQKASGNPFFVEQLAGALVESGALEIANGRITRGEDALDRIKLPDTLQGVVATRIDRLTASEQLTLKIASVIGRVFETGTLHDIHPIKGAEHELAGTLTSLERQDIATRKADEESASAYFFRHVIIHDVAYELLLETQRRDLHSSVATWYEKQFAEDVTPYYGLLAWHFEKADIAERTLHYLEAAALQARAINANREAVGFLERALKIADRIPTAISRYQRARWERWLGDAYHGLGELIDAELHLRRAVKLFGRRAPRSTLGLVLGVLFQIMVQTWRFALSKIGRRVRLGASDRDLIDTTRGYQLLSEIAYFDNKTVLLAYSTLVALNLAESTGRSPELARAYSNMGITAAVIPLGGVATSYGKRGIETARDVADNSALSYVLMARGLVLYGQGRVAEAIEVLDESDTIAARLGDTRRREESLALTGHLLQLEGRFADARRVFGEVLELAKDDLQPRTWGLLGSFDSAMYLGEPGETITWPDKAVALVDAYPVVADMIYAHGLCGVSRRLRRDPKGAEASTRRAVELMESTMPTSVYALEGYCGATETAVALHLRSGNSPAARDKGLESIARRAVKRLFGFARVFAIARPRARLFEAVLLSARGRRARAQWAVRRSLSNARKHALPYDEVRARVELARQLGAGAEAEEHLGEAGRIAERLGASMTWAAFTRLGDEA